MDILMRQDDNKRQRKEKSCMYHPYRKLLTITLLALFCGTTAFAQVRIKELARMEGVQEHDLVGYGLVIGLEGTGDGNKSAFTLQSIENMLQKFGIIVPPGTIRPRNVAAVIITAQLPPFSRPGDRIDVTVSSLGDARSLQGGVLLRSPLQDDNGDLIAMAQGAVSIGGFNFQAAGSEVRQNYLLVGRVPGGGTVRQGRHASLTRDGQLFLSLNTPDFTTAMRMAETINAAFGPDVAVPENSNSVRVQIPDTYQDVSQLVPYIAELEALKVIPDQIARVVINERTGTIVVGREVTIRSVAVSHGNLSVSIKADTRVSQPSPFSSGETVVAGVGDIIVDQDEARMLVLEETGTVQDVARALNTLGVSPRDMISIFQSIKAAGALDAELVIL
jgi:flagellar P-ring protein FlgI